MNELFEISTDYSYTIIVILVIFAVSLAFFTYFLFMLYDFRKKSDRKAYKNKDTLSAEVAYFSEIGMRERQEDSTYISPLDDYLDSGLFACIADGMGGLDDGHIISQYVVDEIEKLFPIEFESGDYIARKISQVSKRIYDKFKHKGGSTLALVHIFDNRMHFYSVGDSNVILIRKDRATILNYKQNYVGELIAKLSKQNISTRDAYLSPEAPALVEFMGKRNVRVQYTRASIKLIDGDYIVICSDGVTDALPVEHLNSLIDSTAKKTASNIKFNVSNKKLPRQDNYSAVIIKVKRDLF